MGKVLLYKKDYRQGLCRQSDASAEAYILAILALAFSLLNMYVNRAKD